MPALGLQSISITNLVPLKKIFFNMIIAQTQKKTYAKNALAWLTCGPIGYPGWDWPSWLCSDGLLLASDWTEPSRPPGGATGERAEMKMGGGGGREMPP